MSTLISNYEISIWDDILVNGQFVEQKIMTIGADDMLYQGKVIEPNFSKKANGEKKLTFKMYSKFIDNISGLEVINPFCDQLINERKVKLFYENKWYDFIVKNVSENSTSHLNSYQLEDALVQELSKNGFDVAFDVGLSNNLGTAEELATAALSNTNWTVESDLFTERVEEHLVYAKVTKAFQAQRILENEDGIQEIVTTDIPLNAELLIFYSSCTNKPHRFQFIYLPKESYGKYDKDKVTIDENRIITVHNCQYYKDMAKIDLYKPSGQFYLPEELSIMERGNSDLENAYDTTISNWYKGKRFGFAQRTNYVPLLERYCNLYYKSINGEIETLGGAPLLYYGYLSSEYKSPALIANVITNSEFKGNTGWTGAYLGSTPNAKNKYGAVVKSTYGRFVGEKFQTAEEALRSGDFVSEKFSAYMNLTFPADGITDEKNKTYVINSGFYDNRAQIVNIKPNEEWILELTAFDAIGIPFTNKKFLDNFSVDLYEIKYNPNSGGHERKNNKKWGECTIKGDDIVLTISSDIEPNLSEKEYQKRQVKLTITPKNQNVTEIYIKSISLYRQLKNDKGQIIKPGEIDTEGVVTTIYSFVKKIEADTKSSQEDLYIEKVNSSELDYTKYIPIYNNRAEKTRTISIKESNYFNILQSISETFEAWLEIIAERDEKNTGQIVAKKVCFRKYLGNDNYASFRYGVNLKDIQRTYESKALATKLIVKQNNNELGKNGFCTIARAGSNPTGDNVVYDFRYFHNTGLMSAQDYVAHLYYAKNPYTDIKEMGKDVNIEDTSTNAQNYFNRLKKLNSSIYDIGEKISGVSLDLTKLEAEKTVQEGLKSAAEEEIGRVKDEFFTLTGKYPDQLSVNPFSVIKVAENDSSIWGDTKTLNPFWGDGVSVSDSSTITQLGTKKSTDWNIEVYLDGISEDSPLPSAGTFYIQPTFEYYYNDIKSFEKSEKIALEIRPTTNSGFLTYSLSEIDTTGSTLSKLLTEYVEYSKQLQESTKQLNGTDEKSGLIQQVAIKQKELEELTKSSEQQKKYKDALNAAFYSIYYRFIQEGTWISEEYIDDEKYYNDSLSVLYNSCSPQVAYTINVISLATLPGYEHFNFELGDKTYAEDPDFFGQEGKIGVVITEQNFYLDDPSKSTVKVQNFKNQFQDLFQKITATVQQAQYNSGSYEKAAELVNANEKIKGKFVGDALSGMSGKLAIAGQTTVVQDQSGITLTDSATKDEMRLIGGAILMSTADPDTGERTWRTGLTPEGISASLITAGTLNAGEIMIMNAEEPVFRWDAFGLTAFDIDWGKSNISGMTNPYKFVRFDKYGIYGINQNSPTAEDGSDKPDIDGRSWKPTSIDEIDDYATFALTWEGLKVCGHGSTVARIGRQNYQVMENNELVDKNAIIRINNGSEDTFVVFDDGDVLIKGTISANDGDIAGWKITEDSIGSFEEGLGSLYLYSAKKDDGDEVGNWIAAQDYQGKLTFAVSKNGQLIAREADISGAILVTEGGKIGSLEVTKTGICGKVNYYEGEDEDNPEQYVFSPWALTPQGLIIDPENTGNTKGIMFGTFIVKDEEGKEIEQNYGQLRMFTRTDTPWLQLDALSFIINASTTINKLTVTSDCSIDGCLTATNFNLGGLETGTLSSIQYLRMSKTLLPYADSTYNLGSTGFRFNTVYADDVDIGYSAGKTVTLKDLFAKVYGS